MPSSEWPIYTGVTSGVPMEKLLSQAGAQSIFDVADTTERAAVVTALAAAGLDATVVFVNRRDALAGEQLEVTTDAGISWMAVASGGAGSAALPFATGWVTPSSAAVNKSAGWGWFTGVVSRTSGSSTIIATLPVGYRPSTTVQFPLVAMAGSTSDGPRGHYDISTAGVVMATVYASSPTWSTSTWFVLPSIPWRIGG